LPPSSLLAFLPILPGRARTESPAPKRLVAGTRMLEVNGRPAKVFGITGPDGRPGVRLAAGERFRVDLANEAGTRTIVHKAIDLSGAGTGGTRNISGTNRRGIERITWAK
jgi:hypothetical protein